MRRAAALERPPHAAVRTRASRCRSMLAAAAFYAALHARSPWRCTAGIRSGSSGSASAMPAAIRTDAPATTASSSTTWRATAGRRVAASRQPALSAAAHPLPGAGPRAVRRRRGAVAWVDAGDQLRRHRRPPRSCSPAGSIAQGVSRWYGLVYPLFVGTFCRLLARPHRAARVRARRWRCAGWLGERGAAAIALLALAALTRETTLLFVAGLARRAAAGAAGARAAARRQRLRADARLAALPGAAVVGAPAMRRRPRLSVPAGRVGLRRPQPRAGPAVGAACSSALPLLALRCWRCAGLRRDPREPIGWLLARAMRSSCCIAAARRRTHVMGASRMLAGVAGARPAARLSTLRAAPRGGVAGWPSSRRSSGWRPCSGGRRGRRSSDFDSAGGGAAIRRQPIGLADRGTARRQVGSSTVCRPAARFDRLCVIPDGHSITTCSAEAHAPRPKKRRGSLNRTCCV